MPQMGVSTAEGTVVSWSKRPGEDVVEGETICEISTDKIDTEVPSPANGVLREILVEAGATVNVGMVLARIDAAGGHAPDAAPADGDGPSATPAERQPPRCSPVARRVAEDEGIAVSDVAGTGPRGQVRKRDVLAAANAATADRGAPEGGTLSRMRRAIGEHMKRSLETAATCTTWIEADFSHVEARRRELGITALPIVSHHTIATLLELPALNAWLQGDRYTRHDDAVHLGIAVSLGEDGLIVPVVHDAQRLSVTGLSGAIKDVAARARRRELTPDDVHGATFTITNPGQFGSIMCTPVINQPQVGILDVEAIVKRPVVVDGDAIAVRPMCVLGLSWDHRALDGALAAQFLAALKRRIESPSNPGGEVSPTT